MVTNNKDLQPVAAEKLYVALESSRVHEATVKVGKRLSICIPAPNPFISNHKTNTSLLVVALQHRHVLSNLTLLFPFSQIFPKLCPARSAHMCSASSAT